MEVSLREAFLLLSSNGGGLGREEEPRTTNSTALLTLFLHRPHCALSETAAEKESPFSGCPHSPLVRLPRVIRGIMVRNGIILAATVLLAASLCRADFEDLSTPELEDLLNTLEYEEAYNNGLEDYDYQPDGSNLYYDDNNNYDIEPEVTDPEVQDLLDFVPTQVRQPESLAHAPILSGPLSRPLPGGSQKQAQQQQLSNGSANKNSKPASGTPPGGANGVLPAYCDPPNPCPLGYTEKDGCIESFENSSEFSRTYQARQNCLCDSEHMFNCPVEESSDKMNDASFLAALPPPNLDANNPYLAGEKLHMAAKKGIGY